jgi:hypothetical protein
MLLRLPPDPPEKWLTIRSALETPGKTVRLCLILLVSDIRYYLLLLLLLLAAAGFLAKHWI